MQLHSIWLGSCIPRELEVRWSATRHEYVPGHLRFENKMLTVDQALLYHTFAALKGDTRSEMTVGFRHLQGIGTPRHCEDAAFYYRRVADKAITWYEEGPPGGRHITRHAMRLAEVFLGLW